jgi:hypothetical protein
MCAQVWLGYEDSGFNPWFVQEAKISHIWSMGGAGGGEFGFKGIRWVGGRCIRVYEGGTWADALSVLFYDASGLLITQKE